MSLTIQNVTTAPEDPAPSRADAEPGLPDQVVAAAPLATEVPPPEIVAALPTQPVQHELQDAATAALGGVPTRPPGVLAPEMYAPGPAAASQAFTDSHLPVTGPAPLGHTLFDAPSNLADRAARVALVRSGLADLVRTILHEQERLARPLRDLLKDPSVKQAEQFDAKLASKFLTDLRQVVDGLLPKQ